MVSSTPKLRTPPMVALTHAFPGLGKEFMPDLDEGSYLYMPTTMPHASIGEAADVLAKLDMAIQAIPEVESVVGKLGRADTPLDPAPISMIETVINYKSEYLTDRSGRRINFRYDRQTGGNVLVNDFDRQRTVLDLFWRPVRERRNLFFDFDAERVETTFDRQLRLVAGATTMARRVRISGQLKENFDRTEMGTWRRSAVAAQASTILRSEGRAWWHGTQVRLEAEMETSQGRNDWIRLSLGRRLGRSARLEVGTAWTRLDETLPEGLREADFAAFVTAVADAGGLPLRSCNIIEKPEPVPSPGIAGGPKANATACFKREANCALRRRTTLATGSVEP